MPGNACERRRWRIQRAGVGAAVEKIEEKRQPEDFFGRRKRGGEAHRALLPLIAELFVNKSRNIIRSVEELIKPTFLIVKARKL